MEHPDIILIDFWIVIVERFGLKNFLWLDLPIEIIRAIITPTMGYTHTGHYSLCDELYPLDALLEQLVCSKFKPNQEYQFNFCQPLCYLTMSPWSISTTNQSFFNRNSLCYTEKYSSNTFKYSLDSRNKNIFPSLQLYFFIVQ